MLAQTLRALKKKKGGGTNFIWIINRGNPSFCIYYPSARVIGIYIFSFPCICVTDVTLPKPDVPIIDYTTLCYTATGLLTFWWSGDSVVSPSQVLEECTTSFTYGESFDIRQFDTEIHRLPFQLLFQSVCLLAAAHADVLQLCHRQSASTVDRFQNVVFFHFLGLVIWSSLSVFANQFIKSIFRFYDPFSSLRGLTFTWWGC